MAKTRKRNARNQIKSPYTFLIILLVAVLAFVSSYFSGENKENSQIINQSDKLAVYYIDVGQGDCELIVCGNQSVLVDSGEAENANHLYQFLREKGIQKLSCIVITHPHTDHAGAMPYLIENIGAEQIIMPKLTEKNIPTTRSYEKLMESIAKTNSEVKSAIPGEKYSFGDIHFTIYSPVFQEDEELNNMSVVFRLVYGNSSFLFTGDAEKRVERKLLEENADLRSDVLKVAHHGSKTSSTEEFLQAVHPSIAVICCGDGSPSHPNKDILARLSQIGSKVYQTDLQGNIKIETDGNQITVETEK